MTKQRLDFSKIWYSYIKIYTEIFCISLKLLAKRGGLSGEEDNISVELWKCLVITCNDWPREKGEIRLPKFQVPVQDIDMAMSHGAKTLKVPDFTCFLPDPFTASEVALHIECKKLGYATSRNWILNKNYVVEGMKRFDSLTHKYGNGALSGMMLGYIISMTPNDIQTEVNGFLRKHMPNCPDIEFDFDVSGLFQTKHSIQRKSIRPSRFKLIHLWVDIRDIYRPQ